MNILVFFDYIFYRIAMIFDKWFDYGASKEGNAVISLSLLQFISLVSLINLIFGKLDFFGNIFIFISGVIIFIVLNYIRYFKIVSFDSLDEKWSNEKRYIKIIKVIVALIYVAFSIYFLGYKAEQGS